MDMKIFSGPNLKLAFKSLKTNRLRSFLTILGMVVGIAAVITVFSAGAGIKGLVLEQVDMWGSDFLEVEVKVPSTAKNSSENGSAMAMGFTVTTLKVEDGEAILKNPNISHVYSAVTGQAIATYQNEAKTTNLWGVTSDFLSIDSGKVAAGRFFDDAEDNGLVQVTVLGFKLKQDLFGDQDPLGRYIKIGRLDFKVIGVMEERGASTFFDLNKMAFVPLKTLQKKIMGINHVMFIMAKLKNVKLSDQTVEDITYLMRSRHDITDPVKDDFAVSTMEEAKDMIDKVLGGVTLLLVAIAAISLIVGGVGIMNIMYVSVTERIFEIGLRKALGATAKDILNQFLIEAITLTFLGGIIGIILGGLISWGVSVVAQSQGFTWPFSLSFSSIFIAVGVSIAIGLIFGLYPAKKAAALNPIDALIQE